MFNLSFPMNTNFTEEISDKSNGSVIPKTTRRPWGNFQQFIENSRSTIKIVNINPYSELSLQYHNNRDEFWRVLTGECIVTIGENFFNAKEGSEFFVPRKTRHKIATNVSPVQILEISLGHFEEGDIVRIEDKYGRP